MAELALQPPKFPRAAFAFPLILTAIYGLTTQHVWEDYLITFRHSQNLANCGGLVFQPGERVHGFTSPLGVLLPAAFQSAFQDFDLTFELFRWLGALAFAVGIGLVAQVLRKNGASLWSLAALVVLALEVKGVSFSVNGQETGWMILFLGSSIFALSVTFNGASSSSLVYPKSKYLPPCGGGRRLGAGWGEASENQTPRSLIGSPHLPQAATSPTRGEVNQQATWLMLGLAWAGLQWTRPDGVVIGGAFAIARLLFADATERRALIGVYLKALGLAFVLYLPWLAFTTLYYGSPIPHTVVAKSAVAERPTDFMGWWNRFIDRLGWILQPTCFFMGGWPPWTGKIGRTIAFAGLFLWMIQGGGSLLPFARRASFAYLLLVGYFCLIPLSAWYIPPAALLLLAAMSAALVARPLPVLVLLVGGYTFSVLVEEARWRIGHSLQNTLLIAAALLLLAAWKTPRWLPTSVGFAGIAVYLATLFGMSTWQIRMQQEVVENGCRTNVGRWLKKHVADDETVFAECLGYLGFHSQRRMLDFPGLASPKVAEAHRKRQWPAGLNPIDRMVLLIPDLKPDWVVLRPHELATAQRRKAIDDYAERVRFDVSPAIAERCSQTPGVGYLKIDSCFIVLQRKELANAPSNVGRLGSMLGN